MTFETFTQLDEEKYQRPEITKNYIITGGAELLTRLDRFLQYLQWNCLHDRQADLVFNVNGPEETFYVHGLPFWTQAFLRPQPAARVERP